MNKQDLIKSLEEKGWKKIKQDSVFLGHHFQIIGERGLRLSKWHILVDFTDNLDEENMERFREIIADIIKKPKNWFMSKWFLFCVITDRIDPQVKEDIKKDSFKPFRLPIKRIYYSISFFSTMLILILVAILTVLIVKKEIDWSMVFALSYGVLAGQILLFGLLSEFRLKGGGNIFFLDLNEKKIYGEVLNLPLPLYKYSKEMNEILQKII